MSAFYELRQYHIRPGKMKEWLELMEKEIMPFQISKGMVITGSYRGETDDSVYIWTRRFESEAEREKLYAAVYQSEHWMKIISPTARRSRCSGSCRRRRRQRNSLMH